MGNLVAKISENKYQAALVSLALTLAGFVLYQQKQTAELQQIANSIAPNILPIPHDQEIHKQVNQNVILSDLIKKRQNPIYRVAITGGPCAGKSTSLQTIKQHFTKQGFHVMIVPQIPTLVHQGGGMSDFPTYGAKDRMNFQLGLMKLKIYFQDYIARLAEMSKKPTLILSDRGLVDCAAYMPRHEFQALLDQEGWTWSYVRDKRYDSVIFLNSAAKGAEVFYTLANNDARTESVEAARALDDKTLAAWVGHPYMTICSNQQGKSFAYKLDLVLKAVQKTIGLEPTQIYNHKYLVEFDHFPQQLLVVESSIEQIFLKNENPRYIRDKIKKRCQDNSFTYQRKYIAPYNPNTTFRQVVRQPLNSLQYATLAHQNADPYYRPLHIKRKNFEWNGFYFSLDSIDYIKNHKGALLLRFEADIDNDVSQILPPWIKVIRDVRKDRDFSLDKIAYREY